MSNKFLQINNIARYSEIFLDQRIEEINIFDPYSRFQRFLCKK